MTIIGILITLALILCMFIACEIEGGVIVFTAGVILYLILMDYLSTVLSWTYNHWQYSIVITLSYLLLGLLWSFFKWYKFIIKSDKDYGFISSIKIVAKAKDVSPIEVYFDKKYLDLPYDDPSRAEGRNINSIPKISNHIAILTTWLFLWPTSMIIFIVGDLIWNIFNNIAKTISKIFQSVYKGITNYTISKLLNKRG